MITESTRNANHPVKVLTYPVRYLYANDGFAERVMSTRACIAIAIHPKNRLIMDAFIVDMYFSKYVSDETVSIESSRYKAILNFKSRASKKDYSIHDDEKIRVKGKGWESEGFHHVTSMSSSMMWFRFYGEGIPGKTIEPLRACKTLGQFSLVAELINGITINRHSS